MTKKTKGGKAFGSSSPATGANWIPIKVNSDGKIYIK